MLPAHATTVLAVRHDGKVVVASDGQVTLGQTIVKHQAKKVRRVYPLRRIGKPEPGGEPADPPAPAGN